MQFTNFAFLYEKWPELAGLGTFAEQYMRSDPQSSRMKCRLLAEHLALLTCKHLHYTLADSNFLSMLKELEYSKVLPKSVLNAFHHVRIAGNKAAHALVQDTQHAEETVRATFDLARWWFYFNTGSTQGLPQNFTTPCSQSTPSAQEENTQAQVLQDKTQQLIQENTRLRAEYEKLSGTVQAQMQEQGRHRAFEAADVLQFSEAETRKRLIDTMLSAAGWHVTNKDAVGLEVELADESTFSGTGFADYVLYDDDGTALAVIEAKKTSENPHKGRKQAQGYANALQKAHSEHIRPLIILTNGYETILVDDQGGPRDLEVIGYADRQIYGIPSKESLQYRVRFQRAEMRNPSTIAHRADIAGGKGRIYQLEAIKAVCECFGKKRRRKALIVQATGTGKTRVAVALADVLMRAGFAKRVLFLCDRKELRRQAKNAFTQFLPDHNVKLLGTEKAPAAHVVLATYPGMMQRFQSYDIAWFDLIIADESHRSIYNKYRDLFLYFDALHLGLTATPRHRVSHNTYGMFGCGANDPTYYYEYDRAIEEGTLVDFTPIHVTTKFMREGINTDTISEEEKMRLEEQGIDVEGLEVNPHQLDSQAYNIDTNRLILQNLMQNGLRDASENGPGKSIIFARNHKHAELLGKIFQETFGEYGPDYCAVIDNYNPRAEQLIDDFKTPQKNPIIAVSVDMLDTGIDVPEVLNLVFAKPVKSYVKFWQMVGRGTRLCESLHGPAQNKERFYIFDHWGNCDYFGDDRNHEEAAPSVSLMERLFEARVVLAETALNAYDKPTFERTIPLIRTMLKALPDSNLAIKEKYSQKYYVLTAANLEHFEPALVTLLYGELAPLMRHISIRGEKEAFAFDLLMTQLQTEFLLESVHRESLKAKLDVALAGLQTHILAVQEQFPHIKALRSADFWQKPLNDLISALEEKRIALRDIMQYSVSAPVGSSAPTKIVDIADGDVQIRIGGPLRPSTQAMQEYHKRVRDILTPYFETHPVLRKLRHADPLSGSDFDQLAALILAQNSDVNLDYLRQFYPSNLELQKELRAIVGMDAQVVAAQFSDFFVKYPGLNALQTRFLQLLQKHIATYGPIGMEKLYTAPFTTMSAQGPEGIFGESQIHDLEQILQTLDKQEQTSA